MSNAPTNPSRTPSSASGVCDPKVAIARLGGDAEIYRHLTNKFFADRGAVREKLSQAMDTQSCPALERAAHSLKGVAATCGASNVASFAARLEAMGRAGTLPNAEAACSEYDAAMSAAENELSAYLGRKAGGS